MGFCWEWKPVRRTELPEAPEQRCRRTGEKAGACGECRAYVEVLHRLGDVELVHGGDDDGRRGEEEEQEEEDAVDDETADPPGDPAQRQVLPGEKKRIYIYFKNGMENQERLFFFSFW